MISYNDLDKRYKEQDQSDPYQITDYLRNNVGVICLLKHIQSGKEIVVANTHMHWNKRFSYVKYG